MMTMQAAIAQIINGRDLDIDQAEAAMNSIMRGEATSAQIGSYLTALRMKGETADEIAGSAKSMLNHVIRVDVELEPGMMMVDTCGTGGDGKHTFNISTTAAFVVAGYGIKVAKHGNRAASSKSGSADVLFALGGNLDLTPQQVAECLDDVGIGFLYAVNHHPAMRYAVGPRREIGLRTIFNLLGPLTNPAGATHQLIGVYDPTLTAPLAEVLGTLGLKGAFVVHGFDGLDELSTTGPNRVSQFDGQDVTTFELDPEELGLAPTKLEELVGGTPEENARITWDILGGQDRGPRRDIVILNAAGALCLGTNDWNMALTQARESIESGAALSTLETWIAKTQSYA